MNSDRPDLLFYTVRGFHEAGVRQVCVSVCLYTRGLPGKVLPTMKQGAIWHPIRQQLVPSYMRVFVQCFYVVVWAVHSWHTDIVGTFRHAFRQDLGSEQRLQLGYDSGKAKSWLGI